MTFALLGIRHTHVLSVQWNDPVGQSAPDEHSAQALATHTGADDDEHVPHEYVPPQSSATAPQFLPEHAADIGFGVQPHTLTVPPPPQLFGEVHEPHV
jgi:hypothetical protein